MNYGYQQPGGMMQSYAPQPPMMPGSGYGAPMMTNFQNTTADVEAQLSHSFCPPPGPIDDTYSADQMFPIKEVSDA